MGSFFVGFVDAAFERVPSAFGIGFRGLGLAEELAEVEEVLLASATLGERNVLPFLDEFVGGQVWAKGMRSGSSQLARRRVKERTLPWPGSTGLTAGLPKREGEFVPQFTVA